MRLNMLDRRGFTLMELLVVLLIIGVLSTVAIRTIDATRNRALFDQTTEEMKEIVRAIVGNPELVTDGRRVDYGFFGDVGRLPNDLDELVKSTASGWRGPYIRREFAGDSTGFLHDAWGNPYTYDNNTGIVATLGDGEHTMTVMVADSLPQLTDNSVVGNVSDADNNPPGGVPVTIKLYTASGTMIGYAPVDKGGYYEFSPGGIPAPMGNHRLVASYGPTDSITRWVSVAPRSRVVVDFKFSRPFRHFLKTVGPPTLATDSTSFVILIVNDHVYDISVDSIELARAPTDSFGIPTAYMRNLTVNGPSAAGFPVVVGNGYGHGDVLPISGGVVIEANRANIVALGFLDFDQDILGGGPAAKIQGEHFRLRFSDDSEISFTLPLVP